MKEDFVEIEIQGKKAALQIKYGVANTLFGNCLIGFVSESKVCYLHFIEKESLNTEIEQLRQKWPNATFKEDNEEAENLAEIIFSLDNPKKSTNIVLQGTDFEINVWKSVSKIPLGSTMSYADVAVDIGNPKATRAVATAIANNDIAFLIPCHRVISKSGTSGNYRWGINRKSEILLYEKALTEQIK